MTWKLALRYGLVESGDGESFRTMPRGFTALPILPGSPRSMLHLELHVRGTREDPVWNVEEGKSPFETKPGSILDPTPAMRQAMYHSPRGRKDLRLLWSQKTAHLNV